MNKLRILDNSKYKPGDGALCAVYLTESLMKPSTRVYFYGGEMDQFFSFDWSDDLDSADVKYFLQLSLLDYAPPTKRKKKRS